MPIDLLSAKPDDFEEICLRRRTFLRITLGRDGNRQVVDMRIFVTNDKGFHLPTKAGFLIGRKRIFEVIDVLARIKNGESLGGFYVAPL
jgi:hypothetical protein